MFNGLELLRSLGHMKICPWMEVVAFTSWVVIQLSEMEKRLPHGNAELFNERRIQHPLTNSSNSRKRNTLA